MRLTASILSLVFLFSTALVTAVPNALGMSLSIFYWHHSSLTLLYRTELDFTQRNPTESELDFHKRDCLYRAMLLRRDCPYKDRKRQDCPCPEGCVPPCWARGHWRQLGEKDMPGRFRGCRLPNWALAIPRDSRFWFVGLHRQLLLNIDWMSLPSIMLICNKS